MAAQLSASSLAAIAGSILIGAPLAGVLLAGKPVDPYLQFPPRPAQIEAPGFSWTVFWAIAALVVTSLAPFAWRLFQANSTSDKSAASTFSHQRGKEGDGEPFSALVTESASAQRHRFPVWGWVAVTWLAASWILAWTRFSWFEPFQPHTFTPLWLGYIATVNALTVRRKGSSLLTRDPLRFAMLFPLSALFWWFFEYLNRFVGNWRYTGIDEFGAVEYTLFATLAFSTVLPAVASTAEWIATFRRLDKAFASWFPLHLPRPKPAAAATLVVTTLLLAGLGVLPEYLFPLLWISPLLVIVSVQALGGRTTVFSPLVRGDWRGIVSYALAALMCGFFWEMWNAGSLSRWEYSIAYVDRFRIFEMPLLGYAGYLPFGLECATIAAFVPDRGK
jgi:hypothetical protein